MQAQATTSAIGEAAEAAPDEGDGITIVVPDEPPALHPAAAGAFLRLLLAVAESDDRGATRRRRAA
jgi:hypothetical protein